MAIRTVVFFSKLKPGSELQLTHDLPFEFPSQALSKIEAIKRVSICQGSGFLAAVVDLGAGVVLGVNLFLHGRLHNRGRRSAVGGQKLTVMATDNGKGFRH